MRETEVDTFRSMATEVLPEHLHYLIEAVIRFDEPDDVEKVKRAQDISGTDYEYLKNVVARVNEGGHYHEVEKLFMDNTGQHGEILMSVLGLFEFANLFEEFSF